MTKIATTLIEALGQGPANYSVHVHVVTRLKNNFALVSMVVPEKELTALMGCQKKWSTVIRELNICLSATRLAHDLYADSYGDVLSNKVDDLINETMTKFIGGVKKGQTVTVQMLQDWIYVKSITWYGDGVFCDVWYILGNC